MNKRQRRGVRITVAAVGLFILVAVAAFVLRLQQPRLLSPVEMKSMGAYMFETPRNIGPFELVDHRGEAFTRERLTGGWTLIFFGFTFCPDICPTTMSFLNAFIGQLEDREKADTRVVMITVDPARDSVEQLAEYVPFFNSEFLGVTGDFLVIHRVATALNTPFRKVPGQGENYQVDHSSNLVLINPRGDYHGFFKAPLDLDSLTRAYRSTRESW